MTAERIFLPHLAGPLANYPHAKRVGNAIYLSGLSARQPDGSVRGVTKTADGTVIRDIREQTIGVIETYSIGLGSSSY
jgi:2-aminomuconate deaminase